MDNVFETIARAYQSLWHFKDYGNTLEIITPVATTNNMFVSVFITKRGNDYIATDGGWIDSGLYDCNINWSTNIFHKIGNYYIETLGISRTESGGKIFYFKRIDRIDLLPNIVFDMTNFINAIVSSSNIPFVSDKVENSFKKEARGYFIRKFGSDRFEFDKPLNGINVRFNAIERNMNGINLINFVSGSNSSYYSNALCRSNMNFQMVLPFREKLGIRKTITLLDDKTRSVLESPQVQTYYNYLNGNKTKDNVVLLWSQKDNLALAE